MHRVVGHVVAALAAWRTIEGEVRASSSLALLNTLQDTAAVPTAAPAASTDGFAIEATYNGLQYMFTGTDCGCICGSIGVANAPADPRRWRSAWLGRKSGRPRLP